MTNTIETKVIAAVGGLLGSGAVSGFVLWLLGVLVWRAPDTAAKATAAVGAVPGPVQALIAALLGTAGVGAAGYLAPHTDRAEGAHSGEGTTVQELVSWMHAEQQDDAPPDQPSSASTVALDGLPPIAPAAASS